MFPSHDHVELSRKAKAVADSQVFGHNYENLAAVYRMSHQIHGPAYTQNLMDNTAMLLREDHIIEGNKQQSLSKKIGREAIEKLPEYQAVRDAEKDYAKLSKKDPSLDKKSFIDARLKELGVERPHQYDTTGKYEKPGAMERKLHSFVYGRLSPFIAINHLGTAFNIGLSNGWGNMAKALADNFSSATKTERAQMFQASGILGEGVLRGLHEQEAVREGILTQYTPKSVQDFLSKVTSTPLFSIERNWQTHLAGHASFHELTDLAEDLAKDPYDKYTIAKLNRYGMGAEDLGEIRRTGKLNDDQMTKGIYYGVDRSIFLDTRFNRSFNSGRNVWARMATMYHNYVSSQGRLMADEFKLAFSKDTRSIGSMAKFVTTAGIIFPVVGEALKIAEPSGS